LAVNGKEVEDILRTEDVSYEVIDDNVEYIISLVPYPTKASLISEDSIDNNNFNFIEKISEVFEHIGNVTEGYNCPKILGFHGNVTGAVISKGQEIKGQDIIIPISVIRKAKAHYNALNHIHKWQEIDEISWYSGSPTHNNFGELEQKYFQVIEFDEKLNREIRSIPLTATHPMVKLEGNFIDGEFVFTNDEEEIAVAKNPISEVWLKISVKENERSILTEEKKNYLVETFGTTKIDYITIPVERESRSEQIMHCKSLVDEVKEYAAVTEQPINGTIEKKVAEMQEGVSL